MRWDNLFDDLEGQLEQELSREDGELRAEEERLRLGRLSLRSRLTGASTVGGRVGAATLRITVVSGDTLLLKPTTFGRDWLAAELLPAAGFGRDGTGRSCILPFAAIAGVVLPEDRVDGSLEEEPAPSARIIDRIGLAFVLRDLCRRRNQITLHTASGLLTGTIDRVGRDHVDLAVHPVGTARRRAAIKEIRIIPLEQIQLVLPGSG